MAWIGASSGVISRSATTHQWLRSAVSRKPGKAASQSAMAQGLARLRERWVSKLTARPLASAKAIARGQNRSCSRQLQLSLPVITVTFRGARPGQASSCCSSSAKWPSTPHARSGT